eukprot:2609006-Pleurochrysis_carterae.AAC.2
MAVSRRRLHIESALHFLPDGARHVDGERGVLLPGLGAAHARRLGRRLGRRRRGRLVGPAVGRLVCLEGGGGGGGV